MKYVVEIIKASKMSFIINSTAFFIGTLVNQVVFTTTTHHFFIISIQKPTMRHHVRLKHFLLTMSKSYQTNKILHYFIKPIFYDVHINCLNNACFDSRHISFIEVKNRSHGWFHPLDSLCRNHHQHRQVF